MYEDFILSINGNTTSGRVAFNLVKNCKTDEYPEGNCKMAWDRLVHKYAPKTATSYFKLKKQFTNSKLESAEDDPDAWITDLESLRVKMDQVNISSKMSDMDFIIHILTNLPKEYEVAVDTLKGKMQDKSNPLSIKTVGSKLNARLDCLSVKQEKIKEEKVVTML